MTNNPFDLGTPQPENGKVVNANTHKETSWEKEIRRRCHMLARFAVIGFKDVKEGEEIEYFDNYIKDSIEVKDIERIFSQAQQEAVENYRLSLKEKMKDKSWDVDCEDYIPRKVVDLDDILKLIEGE